LATANWNGSTKIWDLETLQLIRTLKIGGISAMALSLEDRILATTSSDAEVKVWNVASGNPIASLKGSEDSTLAFSPDGKFLVTGGSDQIVRLWDVATPREIGQLHGHGSEVTSVDFSSDGQTVASGSKDKTAILWNIHPRRQPVAVWNVVSRPIFSPDGKLVAAGIEKDKVVAWDVATLKEKAVFVGAAEPVAFSDNGRALITRSANYFLRTFDVDTQIARETILDGPVSETNSHAALSPDGRLLAIGGANGTLTFCNAMTGVVIAEAAHAFASNIFQIAFSPNGNFLAATGREIEAGRSPTAKVWNAATHERVAILVGHTDVVLGAAFSPDGQILATCGADNAIRFWDTTSWKEIPPSLGQKNIVRSLAYSPNGKTLASASFDGKLKLWNVATRREVASLNFKVGADVLAFSPTGQTLLAGGGGIQFWRAPMPTKQDKPSEE
jgi:WD40 repeat protein